jgi:hypothetical protein
LVSFIFYQLRGTFSHFHKMHGLELCQLPICRYRCYIHTHRHTSWQGPWWLSCYYSKQTDRTQSTQVFFGQKVNNGFLRVLSIAHSFYLSPSTGFVDYHDLPEFRGKNCTYTITTTGNIKHQSDTKVVNHVYCTILTA